MLELSRTVRFCLNGKSARQADGPPVNGFSAWPAMRGLGRYYEITVQCRGEADPVTGYFINIKHIDAAVRDHALPYLGALIDPTPQHPRTAPARTGHLSDQSNHQPTPPTLPKSEIRNPKSEIPPTPADLPMGEVMRHMLHLVQPPLNHTVSCLTLVLSPFHRLQIESHDMDSVVIRQQYEFSAAHRLHVPQLSDQENRQFFGKCNNPSGHGHNYRVEVAVRAPIDPTGRVLLVEDLDALVDEAAIDKLDHKHLNIDVPQFADLNPSVENIARVIHEMLADRLKALDVTLEEISVWETSKTVCTYRGT